MKHFLRFEQIPNEDAYRVPTEYVAEWLLLEQTAMGVCFDFGREQGSLELRQVLLDAEMMRCADERAVEEIRRLRAENKELRLRFAGHRPPPGYNSWFEVPVVIGDEPAALSPQPMNPIVFVNHQQWEWLNEQTASLNDMDSTERIPRPSKPARNPYQAPKRLDGRRR